MPNVTTSLVTPELVFAANTAILKAQRALAMLSKFATDFTADAAQYGSTMMIQFFDDGEASEYDEETNNYGHADGSTSFIPVKFKHHPKKSFKFTPQDFINVNGTKFWENSGTAAGRAVERSLLRTAAQYINANNIRTSGKDIKVDEDGEITGTLLPFGAGNELVFGTGKVSKDNVAEDFREACDKVEIDPGESVLLLNGRAYGQVLATLDAHKYGDPEAIKHGIIEALYGFDSVICMDYFAKDQNLIGAIVPRNALGIAGRTLPVLNPQLCQEVGTTTDENSGLTLQFRRIGDANTDTSTMTAEALFGSKLLQPTKIVRIVSAHVNPTINPYTPEEAGETGETGETGPTAE